MTESSPCLVVWRLLLLLVITREFIEFIFMEIQRVLVRHCAVCWHRVFLSFPHVVTFLLSLAVSFLFRHSCYSLLAARCIPAPTFAQWKWNTRITMLLENSREEEKQQQTRRRQVRKGSQCRRWYCRWSMKVMNFTSVTFSGKEWRKCGERENVDLGKVEIHLKG